MLKKIFKAVTALILLVGCYLGYVRAFAVVVEQFRAIRRVENNAFVRSDSRSKREAIDLAKLHFGDDHWSANEELMFRYYNSDRGFWMYAKEVVRVVEQDGVKYDGKRVTMAPFALIWLSADGKSAKTVLSDRAVFDLNEPLSMNVNPGGKALKIKHALIEQNVLIRDNHGTPRDLGDDMNIGPLTAVEYDEPTRQIRSGSDVIIQDRDMRITGLGMLIQLRAEDETPGASRSPTGFQGAETLYLHKDVHVVMRDVGKSGILPGSAPPKRAAPAAVPVEVRVASGPEQAKVPPAAVNEPTPIDVRCDSTMRVDMAKPQTPIAVGPPAPPSPTLVQFDRNVVVLRGPVGSQRDQLTCDTLKLTLVPGEKTTKKGAEPKPESPPEPNTNDDKGPFGDLTLQRAHATGHAVWLYLPAHGIKLRCNELRHVRNLWIPFKPDVTYFRGDLTRPIELNKIDVVQEEGPDHGKVKSVTHIRTVDATMFDRGNGLDTANVIARGPGRLETRPDRDQPVERIAIWQNQLDIQNEIGPDGRVKQKIIVLSGSRPCFVDAMQKTSLDSASTIWVWLKPKPPSTPEAGASPAASGNLAGTGTTAATPIILASSHPASPSPSTSSASIQTKAEDDRAANADLGGGGFQIDRLRAFRDVHLLAPSKTMTARERLDADFVEAEPTAVVSAATTEPERAADSPATIADPPQAQTGPAGSGPSSPPVTAQNPEQTQPTEPAMTGSAERVWAKIVQSPGSKETKTVAGTTTKSNSTAGGLGSNAEVRKVWLFGNVALHQDPGAGKTKGQEASGEAVYLDNRGKGKAHTIVYQRDPSEKTRRPGPLPLARVENEDNKIAVAGFLTMNQETDQVWANGRGRMTQLAARGFLADKSTDKANSAAEAESAQSPQKVAAKPKRRAGVTVSEKAPMTITFTERMEFNGRTSDPEGRPSARADFFGTVTAKMEDGLLYCEEQMITFTDKEVPLAQLGAMSKDQSKSKAGGNASDAANEDIGAPGEAETPTQAQLARIDCFKNAYAISRKVDPESPTIIQKQKIYAYDSLVYNHLTGDFEVFGKGVLWLFDRDKKSSETPDQHLDGNGNGVPDRSATGRTVTPTSGRTPRPNGGAPATAARSRSTARPTPPADKPKTREVPPLVLTQIQFVKGMRGQYVSSKADDKPETQWSEFFGDIQVARAQVPTEWSVLNPDKLPRDGIFLTGQTARVIGEPPPASAPPSTPTRHYLKIWDRARGTSIDRTLDADVITYDTYKDLLYANGEQGRKVYFADQHAPGQPATTSSMKALQLNPKTGAVKVTDSDTMMLLDKKTGVRPTPELATDPYAKPKKPFKKPYRTAPTNIDRRNFTGS